MEIVESMTAEEALVVLLERQRWDDQGGYPGWNGKNWSFVSSSLCQVTADEMTALFDIVGIVPDVIKPKGRCIDCKFSVNGQERGYSSPCVSCSRPVMSHFERSV